MDPLKAYERYLGDVEWRKEEPYPVVWNRIIGPFTGAIHKGRSLPEVIEIMRSFFIRQGWGFSSADFVELSVDHVMAQKDLRVYKLHLNLIESLLRTSIKRIPGEFLRVPFPRIYLDISDWDFPVKIQGNWGTVRGIVVEDRGSFIEAALIRYVPENIGSHGQKWPFAYSILRIRRDEVVEIPSARKLAEEYRMSEKMFEDLVKTGVCTEDTPHLRNRDTSVDRTTRTCLHLLLTTLLYVNSVNADISLDYLNLKTKAKMKKAKGNRKRKIRQMLDKMGKVYHVGSRLHIPNVPQPSSGESLSTGRKIQVRFRVRGHFHAFWTGSKKEPSERKRVLKWLNSYWKGPEMAEVVEEKIFEVGRRRDGKAEVDEDRAKKLEGSIQEPETDAD